MFRSINQIIFSAFFLFGTILEVEAYSTEDLTAITSTYGSSTVTITTACPTGTHSDGYGDCYYVDTCEMLYGYCDCNYNTKCCSNNQCAPFRITETETIIPNYVGNSDCLFCDCESMYGCCPPEYCAPFIQTTLIFTTKTTTCPAGAQSDGYGSCIWPDSCEMFHGPCDCESERTTCCAPDQCATLTVRPFSPNF
jgi:hypothetical protein